MNERDRGEVLGRYGGWHESLLRIFEAGDRWYKWALYDRDPIPKWSEGRITLLGDAAHPMLPYLGQGACQAIEDGAVLAAALSAEPDDPVAGLARYERTRRPRASRVVLRPASGDSATISARRSPPGGGTSRSLCGGVLGETKTAAAPHGFRHTTRPLQTCSRPDGSPLGGKVIAEPPGPEPRARDN